MDRTYFKFQVSTLKVSMTFLLTMWYYILDVMCSISLIIGKNYQKEDSSDCFCKSFPLNNSLNSDFYQGKYTALRSTLLLEIIYGINFITLWNKSHYFQTVWEIWKTLFQSCWCLSGISLFTSLKYTLNDRVQGYLASAATLVAGNSHATGVI